MSCLFRSLLLITGFAALAIASPVQAQDQQQTQEPIEKTEPVAAPTPVQPSPEADIPPMPVPRPERPDVSMEAYGIANPDCMQWRDSCQTCARDAQNMISCSTPGIACIQGDITCGSSRK